MLVYQDKMEDDTFLGGGKNLTFSGEGQAGSKGKPSLFGKGLLKALSTIFMFKKGFFMITNWTFDILAGYFYLKYVNQISTEYE